MNSMVIEQTILVFIVQLIFIGCRTWNISAIARQDVVGVLVSGTIIHITWLINIAIGSVSMHKLINEFELQYLPIVLGSLSGGLIGSYIAMKNKK